MCEIRRVMLMLGPLSAVLIFAAAVSAQSLPPPAGPGLATHLSVSAGVEQFAFRDVSRNIRPVDASPISWGQIGPTFLHGWCARNRMQLPRLVDLVDDGKWSSSSQAGYNTSASFLAYLLDRHGSTRLRQLYYARSAEFAGRASEVYGKSLEVLETEWLAFLSQR